MIECIDHFVLTVESIARSSAFYEKVLLLTVETIPGRPTALLFGNQKINLHEVGRTFEPKAASPTPGAGDFCFISKMPIDRVIQHLEKCSVSIELGPVLRQGARGPMESVYFRDPDNNLVEVAHYSSTGGL